MDLFENSRTIKDTEINVQLKAGHSPIKQKPYQSHLQEDVGRQFGKFNKIRTPEKVNNVDEDCFVSPVVIREIGEIALDSQKLNNSCIKRGPPCRIWRNY